MCIFQTRRMISTD